MACQSTTSTPPPPRFAQAHRTFPLTKMTAHVSTSGWLTSARVQAQLHDAAADGFRTKETVLDSVAT